MTSSAAWLLLAVSAGGESIDSILDSAWRQASVRPAELCTDDEFLRRASLDLIGRTPSLDDLHRFRERPDRAAKIDELVESDAFGRFWSEIWTASLNGYADAFDSDREVLRSWLEESLNKDVPYDAMVRELIVTKSASGLNGPANFLLRHPEQPTVKVVRMFLGVRLDCARCHDHPFARWKKTDFEQMGRFFEATRRQEVSEGNIRLVDFVPDEDHPKPRFLTGATPITGQWRDEFALFVIKSKPFARTFANRVWYQLMGRGIVHPPDDFSQANGATVPLLLEFLAHRARRERFSVKSMAKRICNSRAYQLSSRGQPQGAPGESLFASRLLRPLTPEQTFDSATVALDMSPSAGDRNRYVRRATGRSLDEDFSMTWDYRETVQAMMARLNAALPAPADSAEQLFQRILSRDPTTRERQICEGRDPNDIAFALINSNEFFFNH